MLILLQSQRREENDELCGKYEQWYPHGIKWEEAHYEESALEGEYNTWHSNGNKWQESLYKINKLQKCILWDCLGNKFQDFDYTNV
ncbi:Putative MORN-repeat protein [Orpheovirus IHUMI-LCC2]|uniref:MORN-repeat protein n=1 Tax=Orpheovirus IHUMI-LCC2 TaxID=2023057 RepID=A0A2I2L473_9VIRU|nr:Putative MORN-repeat protein [Orpheovirus IHUMI-LCC2]SNW62327.1 Putative MORN-repeat protein [Orpheovirus IHUMI-LCC2]